MLTIVYPNDPSTAFLSPIVTEMAECFTGNQLKVIRVGQENEYGPVKDVIRNDESELLLFLGHGTSQYLFGGCDKEGVKTPFFSVKDLKLLESKNVIFLSCHSAELLKKSPIICDAIKAVGFGLLPSEEKEFENVKKLQQLNFDAKDIVNVRLLIVSSVVYSLKRFYESEVFRVDVFYDSLKIFLNNELILSMESSNFKMANLIFYMMEELSFINY